MQTQPKRVVRTIVRNVSRRNELNVSVSQWRAQAGSKPIPCFKFQPSAKPNQLLVSARFENVLVGAFVLIGALVFAAHKLGLV